MYQAPIFLLTCCSTISRDFTTTTSLQICGLLFCKAVGADSFEGIFLDEDQERGGYADEKFSFLNIRVGCETIPQIGGLDNFGVVGVHFENVEEAVGARYFCWRGLVMHHEERGGIGEITETYLQDRECLDNGKEFFDLFIFYQVSWVWMGGTGHVKNNFTAHTKLGIFYYA